MIGGPIAMILAITHAAVDSNSLAMGLIGATVS